LNLLFLTDLSQLSDQNLNDLEFFKDSMVVSGDMTVSFELERRGISFIDEWDFLNPQDIQLNKNAAYSLAKNWAGYLGDLAQYYGFLLKDCVNQDLVYAFEASLNAKTIYNKLFDKYSPTRLRIYSLPQIAVIRTGPAPTSRAVNAVAQAVLFYTAERRGICVEKLTQKLPLSFGRGLSIFQSTGVKKSVTPIKKSTQKKEVIILYKTGMPEREYVELVDVLDKSDTFSVITLTQDSLESDIRVKKSIELQPLWDQLASAMEKRYLDNPEIFSNPHLAFQFNRIKKEIESACVYADAFSSLLTLLKPVSIIFGHEAFTIERHLVDIANAREIPTISLVHGGLGFKYGFRGIVGSARKVLVWNSLDVDWLLSLGVEEDRLVKIGGLRYEDKYFQYANSLNIRDSAKKSDSKKYLGLSQDKPLIAIVTAEISTGLAAPVASPLKHRQLIRELLAFIQRRKDINFIIKAHPGYDYYPLYRQLLSYSLPNLFFDEELTLDEVIAATDICIMINYCTTAALEAMIRGIPVVFVNNAVYDLPDWIDTLSDTEIPRVTSIKELEITIEQLLNDKNHLERVLSETNIQVKRFLDIQDVSSSNRLLELVAKTSRSQHGIHAVDFGLSNLNDLESLLNSGARLSHQFTDSNIDDRSAKSLMFALAYISGFYGADISCTNKIYQLFNTMKRMEKWSDLRWFLLQPYITGRLNNPKVDLGTYFVVRVLLMYISSPSRIIQTSPQFRKTIAKYVISRIIGRNLSFCLMWLYKLRDKYFP